MWGFESLKDVLVVIIIPFVLVILGLTWPAIQAWYRRRAFQSLILRELEELSPYSKPGEKYENWYDHLEREFIHQKIFKDPSSNRDFILSLDPNLVYFVSQLWEAFDQEDGEQWLWYLKKIYSNYDKTGEIKNVYKKWKSLIDTYKREK